MICGKLALTKAVEINMTTVLVEVAVTAMKSAVPEGVDLLDLRSDGTVFLRVVLNVRNLQCISKWNHNKKEVTYMSSERELSSLVSNLRSNGLRQDEIGYAYRK